MFSEVSLTKHVPSHLHGEGSKCFVGTCFLSRSLAPPIFGLLTIWLSIQSGDMLLLPYIAFPELVSLLRLAPSHSGSPTPASSAATQYQELHICFSFPTRVLQHTSCHLSLHPLSAVSGYGHQFRPSTSASSAQLSSQTHGTTQTLVHSTALASLAGQYRGAPPLWQWTLYIMPISHSQSQRCGRWTSSEAPPVSRLLAHVLSLLPAFHFYTR
jgi:hypothetical protein